MNRGKRLGLTIIVAGFAFIPGRIASALIAGALRDTPKAKFVPLPHHVPTSSNVASFRFAMAHDVLHERFPKHGGTFYKERERRARERLVQIPNESDEALELYDDVGVGLERQGKPAEAIPVLKRKLELQVGRGLNGRSLYTTYANLGTFIAHAQMPKAIAGDAQAKKAVEEGLDFVRKSVEVNPQAHFGREVWQIVLAKFLLAAIEDPALLKRSDFIGDSLDVSWKGLRQKNAENDRFGRIVDDLGRPYFRRDFDNFESDGRDRILLDLESHPDRMPSTWEKIKEVRKFITKVGHRESWTDESIPNEPAEDDYGQYLYGVAFDEPMLGIIGMWRQGGGANPHFALCIGEVMLRVGQRRIAWAAYERAKQLSQKFWPKPELQTDLYSHCESRQKEIEESLPANDVQTLRKNFNDELAYGLNYQREYQQFETDRIVAGADIADEHFFDDFNATHPSIASPTGPEEWFVYQVPDYFTPIMRTLGGALFFSGAVALLTSYLLYRRSRSGAYDLLLQYEHSKQPHLPGLPNEARSN